MNNFYSFLNCASGIKSRKASHILKVLEKRYCYLPFCLCFYFLVFLKYWYKMSSAVVVWRYSAKHRSQKIAQNLRWSFFSKVADLVLQLYQRKVPSQIIFCKYCKIFKTFSDNLFCINCVLCLSCLLYFTFYVQSYSTAFSTTVYVFMKVKKLFDVKIKQIL